MAKIIKIASTTNTPRISSQFKTSRNSTTNPFKYQSFEGNTLDISAFADVFESSANKDTNKLKLIASSVAGSMHKIRTGITEPIVNFVKNIHSGIHSAWDYAKNTNISDTGFVKGINELMNTQISIPGLEKFDHFMHKPVSLPGSDIISDAVGNIKDGILDLGKDINAKWNKMISSHSSRSKISSDMAVADLENLWKSELDSVKLEEVA